MKTLHPFLLILPFIASLAVAQVPGGRIHFANGDRLSGQPARIDGNGHLIWQAANLLDQPSAVRLDTILELRLQHETLPDTDTSHEALVTLNNGDTIRGQLSELDDDYVTLDTWYAGALRIKRSMADSLEIMRSEGAIYRGPDAVANWSASGGADAWSFRNGELIAHGTGSLAREIALPDKCRIGFDLAWRTSLQFRCLLFSDAGDTSTPENCYDLVCQRRFVYLRKRWMTPRSGVGSRTIGQPANISELAEKEKVHIEFFIDRKSGTIAFYVDGRKAQVWDDPDADIGKFGNWIHFISEQYPLRISKLSAGPWQGELPDGPDAGREQEPLDEEGQKIRLQNGDEVTGEVGAITDGVLIIKTRHTDLRIPVERMRTVNLSGGEYEEPKFMRGDIHAWLREGGRITFQLKSFTDNSLTGYSQTFGETKFDLKAFSRLEFNIHNEDLAPLRNASDW